MKLDFFFYACALSSSCESNLFLLRVRVVYIIYFSFKPFPDFSSVCSSTLPFIYILLPPNFCNTFYSSSWRFHTAFIAGHFFVMSVFITNYFYAILRYIFLLPLLYIWNVLYSAFDSFPNGHLQTELDNLLLFQSFIRCNIQSMFFLFIIPYIFQLIVSL